ncbi:MAG: PRC-barrel domain-containing protein [Casimicrobiaceae bacterium]
MLSNLHDLKGYVIRATDGDIGHVKDFYIDDRAWVIRYLVVETGSWLSSRKVLVSPISVGKLDWQEKTLPVSITRQQVANSPTIDTDKPVSRQHENQYLGYYGYLPYWGGPGLWGAETHPNLMMPEFVSTPSAIQPQPDSVDIGASVARHKSDDTHLRSCNVVMGYHVHASDGEIGHVQGMLVDEETWAIRYLVVNTSNWWIGQQVLIAPDWIDTVSWIDGTLSLTVTRQAIKEAPPYDASFQVDRMHEFSLYKHYGNMAYWEKEQLADVPRASAPR